MILKKPYTRKQYADFVVYANNHNCTIVDKGEYLESVEVVIPLEDIKEDKIIELRMARDTEELSPIVYNGYRFDFDKDAIMRMQLAERSLRGTDGALTWTDADNNRVNNVNANDLNAILVLGTVRSNELHIKYNELKTRVESATSQAEVESIVW